MERLFGTADATFGHRSPRGQRGGNVEPSRVEDSDPEAWEATLAVNLLGAYRCIRDTIPISSGAVAARVSAPEVWEHGISVNELVPGPMRTDATAADSGGTVSGIDSEWVKAPEDVVPWPCSWPRSRTDGAELQLDAQRRVIGDHRAPEARLTVIPVAAILGPVRRGSTVSDAMRQVGRLLVAEDDIAVAFVFGSFARDRVRDDSDLDIAVAGSQPLTPQRKLDLIDALALAFGRPVDLVDLQAAGPLVFRQALTTGVCVLKRDTRLYAELLRRLWYDHADLLPCTTSSCACAGSASSVDEAVVAARLEALRRFVQRVRDHTPASP